MLTVTCLILSIAFVAAVSALTITWPACLRVTRALKRGHDIDVCSEETVPSVTVVVYDSVRVIPLEDYLEKLCGQDWPCFNVVLVSDASAADARELQDLYQSRFPKVHFTFIPPGSCNVSRRKLALTVGIKASDSDYILTTVSNCDIPSDRWISLMMASLIADSRKEICLGLSRPDFSMLRGFGKWYRQFDFTLRSMQWIAAAVSGRPMRGDGYNMLFRRDLFFRCNGYSSTTYLESGDDDLFLTEIADGANTVVQLCPDAVLVQQWGDNTDKVLLEAKDRYDFTSRFLPRGPFLKASFVSWCQWIVVFCCAVAVSIGFVWYVAALAALLVISFAGCEIYLYRKAAVVTASVRPWWSVFPFLLWRPFGNLFFRLRHRSSRHRHFTWRPA